MSAALQQPVRRRSSSSERGGHVLERLHQAEAWVVAAWPGLAVALVGCLVVPGPGSAFVAPKTWLLAVAALVALGRGLTARPARAPWLPALLLAAAALSALVSGGGILATVREVSLGALVLGWSLSGVSLRRVEGPLFVAGAAVAAVTWAQALGVDVFGAAAPGRLSLHGTLGNPDFVAAFLVPVLVLLVARLVGVATPSTAPVSGFVEGFGENGVVGPSTSASRPPLGANGSAPRSKAGALPLGVNGFGGLETRLALLWLALPLLVGALAVTRSFATVLSLAAAGAVLAIATPRRRSPRRALAVLGVVLVACLALLVGRDASRALGGRAYLVRVAAPHLLDRPLTGLGPGAVEASWPGWETAAWSAGSFTAAEVPFAAAQDHLHQDFLERAVEQGALGLGALLVVVAVALRRLVRAADPRSVAAAAGIAALLARGLVDFPLARPAEAALFALLLAAGLSSSPPQEEHP